MAERMEIVKHYIIAKFKPGFDLNEYIKAISDIFTKIKEINGVREVNLYPGINRGENSNRYDLMIEIDMTAESLSEYNKSAPHHEWKEQYGEFIESKCIFDREA